MLDLPPIQDPPLARGRTADVYEWRDGQIIKLFYDWVPDSWIQREAEISRAMSASSLPVPKFIEEVTAAGRRGLVFERIAGHSMVELLAARPWQFGRLARQMAELHAALHTENGRTLRQLREELTDLIEGTGYVPAELKGEILTRLGRLPDGDALCHFDFHPGQIILSPKGPVALDWTAALKGDPAADIARTLVLLNFGEVPNVGLAVRLTIALVRKGFQRQYLSRYLTLQPQVTAARVQEWMIPVAAARLAEDISGEREPILVYLARRV